MNTIEDTGQTITTTFNDALNSIVAFLPEFIAGLLILLVGWIVASLLRAGTRRGLQAVDAPRWFREAGVRDDKQQDTWVNILSQIVFWTVIFVFLIPTFETWDLREMNVILSELFLYLPRVFAAIVVGFIGYILAKLSGRVVANATDEYSERASLWLSRIARYAILIFTGMIVFNQLGIASQLIQIFFSAVMFGLALAVGLAFGLGGKEPARELLQSFASTAKQASSREIQVAPRQTKTSRRGR